MSGVMLKDCHRWAKEEMMAYWTGVQQRTAVLRPRLPRRKADTWGEKGQSVESE